MIISLSRLNFVQFLFFPVFLILVIAQVTAGPLEELHKANRSDVRLDLDLVYKVFNDEILTHRNLEPALEELQSVAEDIEVDLHARAKSYLSMAHLLWRYGQFDRAIEVADLAIALEESTDSTLLKARLLDAQGKKGDAVEWYEKTLQLTEIAEEQQFIRIRLAMIDVQPTNVEALLNLAVQEDQEFKNRAALTLAVLGHPTHAVELYRPSPDNKFYFRQLLRLTEWAILAERFELAQTNAWLAYETAETRFDALYALTLVDEAYRKADSLATLLDALSERDDKDQDLSDLHIDLLTDFEKYDEAIALFQSLDANPDDLSTRYRLLQIYDVARRTDEMVDEYRRLIREEPDTVLWYSGLASHFVSVAKPNEALDVWHLLEENNPDNIDILTHGGRYMTQMGFENESMAIVERHREKHGPSTTGQIFLFEAHLANGRYDEATTELEELTASLPKSSGDLRTVADAYERLQRFDLALDVFVRVQESEEEKLGYDDRMRLAWLESVAGNREEALRLWQDIWVQEDTPARRKFAEAQFLLLAAELNQLAKIAIDIERKLDNKEADKNEINLLVRIYTQVNDAFSASEVIEEFALYTDMPEAERLRQIGLVYLQLNEYDKYDKVLRNLVEIDEENRIEHIQNIVLNAVAYTVNEEADDRLEDIMFWLEELRKHDIEAVTGEFEASVLSMSGFTEEAIESYRLALVQQPENSDNMLLMGELMKESDRTEEAVAIFQYIAEHATNDNEFVVAIDGILNMIGQQRFGQRLAFNRQAAFKWAHRIILERITQKADKFYLYTLLAEIATEFLDVESEFVAVENSISQAGIRRLSVLRELVTMSTPGQGFFFSGRSINDPDRQITYGRRLIGLRQQLPPEVYISIAKTLLDQDDQLGAEKALNLIQDITGDLDVNQTKADLFQDAGFYKKALGFYSHALALNQNNLLLLIKTAVLREGNGQYEVAADLYLKGMLNVLRSQPAQLYAGVPVSGSNMGWGPPQNTSVNRDYNTYYEPLIQGLIATWPKNPEKSAQQFETLREFFEFELKYIQTLPPRDEGMQISSFSRLDYFCRFVRRLCSILEHYEFVHSMDLKLTDVFFEKSEENTEDAPSNEQSDMAATMQQMGMMMGGLPINISSMMAGNDSSTSFVDYIEGEYEVNGLYLSEELKDVLGISDEELTTGIEDDVDLLSYELTKAIETKNVERTARLLKIVKPTKPITQIFFDFLEGPEVEGMPSMPAMPFSPFDMGVFASTNPREVLGYARVILGEREYVRMVPIISGKLQSDPIKLLSTLTSAPTLISELEEVVGPFFQSFEDFKQLLDTPEAMPVRQSLHYGNFGLWNYIQSRSNLDDSIEFFQYVVSSLPKQPIPGQQHLYSLSQMYRELVTYELTGSQRTTLKEATLEVLQTIDFQDEFVSNSVWQLVGIFDAHPENLDLLLAVYGAVAERMAEDWKLETALPAYYGGSRQEAFLTLLEVEPNQYFQYNFYDMMGTRFLDEIKATIQSVIDGECISQEQVAKIENIFNYSYRLAQIGEYAFQALRVDYNRGLMECFPEETRYRTESLMWSVQENRLIDARQLFQHTYELDRSNETIRTAFFFWNKQQEYYDDALKIATDGGPDLRSNDIVEDIIARNEENMRTGNMEAEILHAVIPDELRRTSEFSEPEMLSHYPKNITRAASKIAELEESATVAEATEAIRLFWRSLNIQNLDNSSPMYMGGSNTLMFLEWPLDSEMINDVDFYGYSSYGTGNFAFNWNSYLQSGEYQYGVHDQYVRLIDHTSKTFPLGRELELLLRSQSNQSNPIPFFYPSQTNEKSRWYEVVREAYGYHPEQLQHRLQEITTKILAGVANEHEFMMWMHLSNESQTPPSTAVIANFKKWARGIDDPTQSQLLNVARFFAGIEAWDEAIEIYQLLVLNRAAFTEFQEQMFYGMGGEQQLSIAHLIDDAIEWLPLPECRLFIRSVLPVLQRFDDLEIGQIISDTFNLEVISKVFQPDEVFELAKEIRSSTVLPDSRRAALKPFEALPLISAIEVLINAKKYDKALIQIRELLTDANIASSSDIGDLDASQNAMFGPPTGLYAMMNLAQMFSNTLGVKVPFSPPTPSIEKFVSSGELVFAMQDKLFDHNDSAWMDYLTEGMIELLDDETVDRKIVIELLAVLYNESYRQERFENSTVLGTKLSTWFASRLENLDKQDLEPFAYLATHADFYVTSALFSKFNDYGFFSTDEQITLIQKLRETDQPEDLFFAIQKISTDTAGLTLLKEMREVGSLANEHTYVIELDERIEALESALAALQIRVL